MSDNELNEEEKNIQQNINDKSSNVSQPNDKSKAKPMVRCIFCEKLENQFQRKNLQKNLIKKKV